MLMGSAVGGLVSDSTRGRSCYGWHPNFQDRLIKLGARRNHTYIGVHFVACRTLHSYRTHQHDIVHFESNVKLRNSQHSITPDVGSSGQLPSAACQALPEEQGACTHVLLQSFVCQLAPDGPSNKGDGLCHHDVHAAACHRGMMSAWLQMGAVSGWTQQQLLAMAAAHEAEVEQQPQLPPHPQPQPQQQQAAVQNKQ